MEDKNFFTAIILSVLVFVVWYSFFMPAPQEVPPAEQTQKEVMEKPDEKVTTFDKKDTSIIESPVENVITTTVKTPFYEITLSNLGAVVKQVRLKDYKDTNKPDSEMKFLMDPDMKQGSYSVEFKNKSIPGLEKALFSVSEQKDVVDVQNENKSVTYSYVAPNGIIIEKTFEFKPDTYLINCHVTIKNASENVFADDLMVNLSNRLLDKSHISFEGPALYVDKSLKQVALKDIEKEKENHFKGDIKWISIEDRYFMMSLIPDQTADNAVMLSYKESDGIITSQLTSGTFNLSPGVQKVYDFAIYAGPKDLSILRSIGKNSIDKVVNFGWFDFIAKPCLMLMDLIYNHGIRNYGVAIIMLTIMFKIILWPLGNKSYKSMNDMKKLQPLVNDLREKFKNDKQQMNVELMNLYKTYKVNPLSGCLPMIVQMPIFFAFYRMLYSAIELRHAPFMGWITDLSAPDRLFNFGFTIPYYEPPTGIPVLTLLMGASMFLQQKMSPPAGDPAQAKMMMMMPVLMTFIFMNFSSGLVLYWFVNNVVSIIQQYYIMKKNA